MFCTFTSAILAVYIQCPIWLFFSSSLILRSPGMLLRYCLCDIEMVPIVPSITCITFAFTFYMRRISIVGYLCFKIFSSLYLIIFLSPGIATSIDMHVSCLLSRITMSGFLLVRVLSVRTCWFHNMVNLSSRLISTDFGTW